MRYLFKPEKEEKFARQEKNKRINFAFAGGKGLEYKRIVVPVGRYREGRGNSRIEGIA